MTNGVENLIELWSLVGEGPKSDYAFGRENGEQILRRRFGNVERLDADGEVTFPDWESARAHVAASPTRGHLADQMPLFDGPLVARRRVSVFVAAR